MYAIRPIGDDITAVLDATLGLRSVTVCIVVGSSSRDETPDEIGISHMLEHAVMSAKQVVDQQSVSKWVDTVGGQSNASTSKDFLTFWARVPAEFALECADRLERALAHPELTQALASDERRVVLQELRGAAASPLDVADHAFHSALFPGHPLGHPVGGSVDAFPEFTSDRLGARLRAALSNAPICISLVGPTAAIDAVSDQFRVGRLAALDRSTARNPLRRPPPGITPASDDIGAKADQNAGYTYLVSGGRGADRRDELWPAFQLLTSAVGGTPGSMLYERLRGSLGVSYELQSLHSAYQDCGVWRVLAGSEPAEIGVVDREIVACLRSIAGGELSECDFVSARAQAVGSILLDNESPVEHAHVNAYWAVEGLADEPPVDGNLKMVGAARPEQVVVAARRVLDTYTHAVAP
jgi:predicted Zn-dependent peptidase